MPTPEVTAGQLWRVMGEAWKLRANKGDIVLVSYVQPESEAPAPWLRVVEFVVSGNLVRTDSSVFFRAARHGDISLVQVD